MRLRAGPSVHRDRLLDAMALPPRRPPPGGVYWGDCSLANTLFRRDGDRIQAYLVDAETSEVHPALSDGQREYDLEILVENVGFGLADLAALQGRPEDLDEAIDAAERVRDRYRRGLGRAPRRAGPASPATARRSGPRPAAQRPRLLRRPRDRPDVGRAAASGSGCHVTTRRFHARELERRTRLRALEGQARLLLNDLNEYHAWLECYERRPVGARGGGGPLAARGLPPDAGPDRRPPSARTATSSRRTATCSSTSGSSPSGPAATSASTPAIEAYLAVGAPAPERPRGPGDAVLGTLDVESDDPEYDGATS